MDAPTGAGREDADAAAQRLRLRRIMGGCVSYACTALIVICAWLLGFLPAAPVIHYVAAVCALNGAALLLVRTGMNLRFRDPSLTAFLVVSALGAAGYVMYFITEPSVRIAFLMLASVAMLYGLLSFDARGMLRLGAAALALYLLVLLALAGFAPARVDLRTEVVVVLIYTMVLAQTALIGSFVAGLKRMLREKNASLLATMAELEELATRDPLTRLPNRHTAMCQLEEELCRSERRRRNGDGLCLALLDVDDFKQVNDRCGHQAGDEVLKLLGETLTAAMRQGDFVARFGGEEFLLILPETTLEGGRTALERIREAVADVPRERMPNAAGITVSIGLARHQPGDRVEVTLGHADAALYRAKHAGRNRVEVWDASTTTATHSAANR
ncbi:MAG: GGDEF domain-containing protein [Pseudomonadota bacterium]